MELDQKKDENPSGAEKKSWFWNKSSEATIKDPKKDQENKKVEPKTEPSKLPSKNAPEENKSWFSRKTNDEVKTGVQDKKDSSESSNSGTEKKGWFSGKISAQKDELERMVLRKNQCPKR